jgi:tRNA threonylcarbamoyladenosine biosynthesis protein TsaB
MVASLRVRALAVDTSTDFAGVVLWQDGSCVARTSGSEPARHAESLVSLIDGALATVGWKKMQLDLIACCIGPGSFTGVRAGLATAKGIALGLDRPIVGVGSLEAMAAAAGPEAGLTVPLLDARKGELFWAAYADGKLVDGPGHVTILELATVLRRFVGRDPLVVGAVGSRLDLAGARLLRTPATDLPDAAVVARLGLEKLAHGKVDDLHALEPLYVRPPDITWCDVGLTKST